MQNLIHAIGSYVNLNNNDIDLIENLFEKRELKKNEYFLHPGRVCENFAFVNNGLLRHSISNDGDEKTIYFSAENDFVCDFQSFIDQTTSNKAIVAMENTTLYSVTYSNMQ